MTVAETANRAVLAARLADSWMGQDDDAGVTGTGRAGVLPSILGCWPVMPVARGHIRRESGDTPRAPASIGGERRPTTGPSAPERPDSRSVSVT
jgi:hypothetical protein